MNQKLFIKNDDSFTCRNCGLKVAPLGYTSRNHCPGCLFSLHVDVNPGDRANSCGGLMEPAKSAPDAKKGYVIYHRCQKCGQVKRNKAAVDDDMALIIRLSAKQL